jgi:hypothetical protein
MVLMIDECAEEGDDAAGRENPRNPIHHFVLRDRELVHGHISVEHKGGDKKRAGNDERFVLRREVTHAHSMRHFCGGASV